MLCILRVGWVYHQEPPLDSQRPWTYPAAEVELLAVAAAAVDSSCEGATTGATQQQEFGRQQQPSLLRRLLLCGCAAGPRSTGSSSSSGLQQQAQVLLQLAKTPLCHDNSEHAALLQAVYCAYTGECGELAAG